MTKILIDRATVEQALEALEAGLHVNPILAGEAEEALRATLAEPAFHGFMSADGTRVDLCFTPGAPRADGVYATAYYTAPPQRPAEPVAYSVGRTLHWHEGKGVNDAQLFATPPQRKPLTDDAMQKVFTDSFGLCPEPGGFLFRVGRAIERAHGIGGEG